MSSTKKSSPKKSTDADIEEFLTGRNRVRLYALAFGCGMALVVFIGSIAMVPPPRRKWPKKAPLCGFLPWCLISRLLGYGLVQWETGHLVEYVPYIKETHELLSLYYGDMDMIAKQARYAVACVDISCNFAMTMALTDATGTIEGEDFWVDQLWVYVCIFIFQILFGIATRLSAIGVTMHDKLREYMWFCAGVCIFSMFCSLMYTNVIANRSCDSPCVAYNYVTVFLSSQAIGWSAVQPTVLTLKWLAGWGLWYICRDYLTFTEGAMVPMAVVKLKRKVQKGVALEVAVADGMSLEEFKAKEEAMETGMFNVMAAGVDDGREDGYAGTIGVVLYPPEVQTVAFAHAHAPGSTTMTKTHHTW